MKLFLYYGETRRICQERKRKYIWALGSAYLQKTIMHFILPKLANDNDFEDLVKDIFSVEFKNPNLQRYGRKGQAQDGIDIAGVAGYNYETGKPSVLQCKNHTAPILDADLIKEINKEVKRFDKSKFNNCDYFFITSADNSKPVIDHCLEFTKSRSKTNKPAVIIRFWDYVSEKTLANWNILYEYYSGKLPISPPESFSLTDNNIKRRNTYDFKLDQLLDDTRIIEIANAIHQHCARNLGVDPGNIDPYNIYLGISTNPLVMFDGQVDISIDASSFVADTTNLSEKYSRLVRCFKKLAGVLKSPSYSSLLFIKSDLEINVAFTLGRLLRKNKFGIRAVFKNTLFVNDGSKLTAYPSGVQELFLKNQNASAMVDDCVFIFNSTLGTNINEHVVHFIQGWNTPVLMRSYAIADGKIHNSSHALSVATDICDKLHNLQFQGVKRIHLFLATPKPLAMLIGYGLNTLNTDIHLYFMSPDRKVYLRTGIINNNTF